MNRANFETSSHFFKDFLFYFIDFSEQFLRITEL